MIPPPLRIRRAIHNNDPLLVQRILKSHPDLLHNPDTSPAPSAASAAASAPTAHTTTTSNSNLHLAALLGHASICRILVSLGHDDPSPALNEQHQTALMLAAAEGHTDVVLLLAEADPSCILRRDAKGRDAIMLAAQSGHDTVLQILLTYVPGGAEAAVRRADAEGNTALHLASGSGQLLVLRTLLAAGADAERRNSCSWTPVAYSATVQAEVYLKGLVVEAEKRKQLKRVVDEQRSMKAGGVRMVDKDGDSGE